MGILRRVFHLPEAAPNGGKHEALSAPDTGFDPEAQLLQLVPDPQPGADRPGVDEDSDGGAGAEEWRCFGECGLDRLEGIVARDQADRVLPLRNTAGCGGGYPKEAAPS